MSMEQESGSSVLMEMHGIPGMGSMGRPPATVWMGEQENPGSNPIGDDAEMLDRDNKTCLPHVLASK